jgi:hypothetical protein
MIIMDTVRVEVVEPKCQTIFEHQIALLMSFYFIIESTQ